MAAFYDQAGAWSLEEPLTDDTTIEDEYEMQRLDSLTDKQRDLCEKHVADQWEAVPSYFNRFQSDQ